MFDSILHISIGSRNYFAIGDYDECVADFAAILGSTKEQLAVMVKTIGAQGSFSWQGQSVDYLFESSWPRWLTVG
ncbi:MAG: hypothetical protein V7774_09140 [Pseudorhizobium pelagicum]|uniref:hypothetical protein n=1 Tax=Pseudorhizobium pelagicum TaxID=1509405 RepID=UPI003460A284